MAEWPMWVLGLAVMIDNVDQFMVRGTQNQIERAFHVGDLAIAVLFSAFILVNGIATLPASYIGDRWNRTRVMAYIERDTAKIFEAVMAAMAAARAS
jgi:predicted MFS family arabinose efflux permease